MNEPTTPFDEGVMLARLRNELLALGHPIDAFTDEELMEGIRVFGRWGACVGLSGEEVRAAFRHVLTIPHSEAGHRPSLEKGLPDHFGSGRA